MCGFWPQTSQFLSEFCCGFWGRFCFSCFFSQGKQVKNKKSTENSPANFTWRFVQKDSQHFLNRLNSEIPPVLLGIPWPALRGPLRNHFWKKRRPQPYWGGENSGNALEASNALNYRVWGIPAVLSRGIPGNALRAFPGSFRSLSRISSGKSQPYWGYGPSTECSYTYSAMGCPARARHWGHMTNLTKSCEAGNLLEEALQAARVRESQDRSALRKALGSEEPQQNPKGYQNALGWGGWKRTQPPASCLSKAWKWKLGLLTPKLRVFSRISVEEGEFRAPENSKFPPPLFSTSGRATTATTTQNDIWCNI